MAVRRYHKNDHLHALRTSHRNYQKRRKLHNKKEKQL